MVAEPFDRAGTYPETEVVSALGEIGNIWPEFVRDDADLAIAHLSPIADEMRRLMGDVTEINRILGEGAKRAAETAEPVLAETYDIVGLIRSR